VRLGQHQQVVVALEVALVVAELVMAAGAAAVRFYAAIFVLAQLVALDHGTHGAVEDQDALLQLLAEESGACGTVHDYAVLFGRERV
jgi:hypothetical protein